MMVWVCILVKSCFFIWKAFGVHTYACTVRGYFLLSPVLEEKLQRLYFVCLRPVPCSWGLGSLVHNASWVQISLSSNRAQQTLGLWLQKKDMSPGEWTWEHCRRAELAHCKGFCSRAEFAKVQRSSVANSPGIKVRWGQVWPENRSWSWKP